MDTARSDHGAVGCDPSAISRLRRRLSSGAAKYLPLAIALALMGCYGVTMLRESLKLEVSLGFGLGWVIAGFGGAVGVLAICAAALLARTAVSADPPRTGLRRATIVTAGSRWWILLTAIAAETATVLDAPVGIDRNFVIGLNGVFAACLVLLALTANDVGRTVRRFDEWAAARAARIQARTDAGSATHAGSATGELPRGAR